MIFKSLLARLTQGYRTGTFPTLAGPKLPEDFIGRPQLEEGITEEELNLAKGVCPSVDALFMEEGKACLDMGKCIFCGKCAKACPKIKFTKEYRLAVFKREDLIVKAGEGEYTPPQDPNPAVKPLVGKSFQLREVSAGGCAACELDFNVLGTLAWDLSRFGMKVVASPRHADAVYVTGPVSKNMALALKKTYEAMSEPRFVIAAGACAISGGLYAGSPETLSGTGSTLPTPDMYIPGCPPHPATALEALIRFKS